MSYMASKHKEKHKSRTYKFSNYTSNATSSGNNDGSNSSKIKRSISKKSDINTNGYEDINPVQNIDTKYSFENEEGSIIIDLKNDKK